MSSTRYFYASLRNPSADSGVFHGHGGLHSQAINSLKPTSISTSTTVKISSSQLADQPPCILTFPTADRIVSRNITGSLFRTYPFFSVEGACHGLVLLADGHRGWSSPDLTMVLWNPLILEAVEVPSFSLPMLRFRKVLYGFGYDSCRDDDYKIVRMSRRYHNNPDSLVDVYNVKLKTWRRVANPRYDCNIYGHTSGVFVNGCIHWMARGRGGSPVIAAFNLAYEEFDEIPLPIGRREVMFPSGLPVLGGCLAFHVDPPQRGFPLEVWVMKEYSVQESWTKLTINVVPINVPNDPGRGYQFKPVWLLREEEEIVWASCRLEYAKTCDMQLFAYNLRNGAWRDLVVAGDPLWSIVAKNPFISFKETLWSPK